MAKLHFIYFDLHTGYYPSLHHGLAYLIGMLKEAKHDVFLEHLICEADVEKAAERVKEGAPDILALSFTTNQKKYVHGFMDKAKTFSGCIIAGGVHCTLVGEEIFKEFPRISAICVGEGEAPLKEFCARFDKRESLLSTPSFYFKTEKDIVKNELAPLKDIDALSFPDYSLFDYRKIIAESGQCFPMMISRGCPYNCHYCCNHVFKGIYPNKNKYVRFPQISYAISVIKMNLQLYPDAEKVIFADDTFTLNKKWLSEFCMQYKKEINLPFLCNARVETIDDEVAGILKSAGCVSIDFGVESGNEWLRRHILNRKHSNDRIENAFTLTRRHGIKSFSFNIVGLPFETKEMAQDTVNLNIKIKPNFGKCFYFYPYPGSKLYHLCQSYDLLRDDFENVSGYLESPSIRQIFMSHSEMKEKFETMQSFFYAQLLLSKFDRPLWLEKVFLFFIFMFKRHFLRLVDPIENGGFAARFRVILRKIALRYLR
jgi:radical SAM superfamily enzyme YgiQ (UPF0313 family)